MPHAASTGSAAALAWYLKWLPSNEQVVQRHVITVDFDTAADSPSASVSAASTSPDRQAAHEPGDHQRLQGVGLGHALAEQLRGEPLGGAAQLGPLQRALSLEQSEGDFRRFASAIHQVACNV